MVIEKTQTVDKQKVTEYSATPIHYNKYSIKLRQHHMKS